MSDRKKGVLHSWNESRGFGFVHVREGKNVSRFYLHVSKIRTGTLSPLVGQELEFSVSDKPVKEREQAAAIDVDVLVPGQDQGGAS